MHAPETDGLDIERFLAKRRVLETFKEDVDLLEALVIALAEDQVAFPANAEDFIDLAHRALVVGEFFRSRRRLLA